MAGGRRNQCRRCRMNAQKAREADRPREPVVPEFKLCSRCGPFIGPKPREAFTPDARKADGLQSACKDCLNEQRRDRRQNDPEFREREHQRDNERYASDPAGRTAIIRAAPSQQPEPRRAYNQAYYVEHQEELNAASRAYYAEHQEEQQAAARDRYYADVEASRARARRYAAEHRAEAITRARLWILAHPDKVSEYAYRRAQRVQAAFVEEVTTEALAERGGAACWLCTEPVDMTLRWTVTEDAAATVDHVVPISEGGEHSMANARLAHWSCNRKRRRKFSEEELAYLLDLTRGYDDGSAIAG